MHGLQLSLKLRGNGRQLHVLLVLTHTRVLTRALVVHVMNGAVMAIYS